MQSEPVTPVLNNLKKTVRHHPSQRTSSCVCVPVHATRYTTLDWIFNIPVPSAVVTLGIYIEVYKHKQEYPHGRYLSVILFYPVQVPVKQ